MSARRRRSPTSLGNRRQSELVARRGLLPIVVAALVFAGDMGLAGSIASLQ
jgi:hypothetical protein